MIYPTGVLHNGLQIFAERLSGTGSCRGFPIVLQDYMNSSLSLYMPSNVAGNWRARSTRQGIHLTGQYWSRFSDQARFDAWGHYQAQIHDLLSMPSIA
jgi:hypothetical protein